jgi:DNA replication and repair protein RecF
VLVTGPNGAGKTNLLESLHVATQGFSPRTRNDAQLIRFGRDAGRVLVRGLRGAVPVEAAVAITLREGKRAHLNGTRLPAPEGLRAELATLVFTPDRLAVVKGGPLARRAYFDRALGRLFPARSSLSPDYTAAVAQRNAALRRVAAGLASRDVVTPWTERVVETGRALVEARRELFDALAPAVGAHGEALRLPGLRLGHEPPELTAEALDARLDRDLERGTTGLGPHLDDVLVASGDRDLRAFGSQGEQRLALLALVLAEAGLVLERRGFPPLLLLDDVLSELDRTRRATLLERLPAGGQTLVTATDAGSLPGEPDQLLEVRPGEVLAR